MKILALAVLAVLLVRSAAGQVAGTGTKLTSGGAPVAQASIGSGLTYSAGTLTASGGAGFTLTTNAYMSIADSNTTYTATSNAGSGAYVIMPHAVNTNVLFNYSIVGGHLYDATSNQFICAEAGTYCVAASATYQITALKFLILYVAKNATTSPQPSGDTIEVAQVRSYGGTTLSRNTLTAHGIVEMSVGDRLSAWTWQDTDTTIYGSGHNRMTIFRIR